MSSRKSITPSEITVAPVSALVVADGDHAVQVKKVLESCGFVVARPADASMAEELCAHQRFDLGVYDQDVNGALDLARFGRLSSQPRVAIGLLRPDQPAPAAGIRLHFVVHKPFTADLFARTLRATYGAIAADRRVSFRYNVSVDASECNIFYHGELRTLRGVKLVNLSHTGLCLQSPEMLPQGATLEVRFTLPQTQATVQLVGTVMWSHASGRAGIRFSLLDSGEESKLEDWLDALLPNFHLPVGGTK